MFSEVSEVMWQINFQFTLFSLGTVNLLQLIQMYQIPFILMTLSHLDPAFDAGV